jgi:hypothetical protein
MRLLARSPRWRSSGPRSGLATNSSRKVENAQRGPRQVQAGAEQRHGRRGRGCLGVGPVQSGRGHGVDAPEQPAQAPEQEVLVLVHQVRPGRVGRLFLLLEGHSQDRENIFVAHRGGHGSLVAVNVRDLGVEVEPLRVGLARWRSQVAGQGLGFEQGLEHAPQQTQFRGVEPFRAEVARQAQQAHGIAGGAALLGGEGAQVAAPAVTEMGHGQASSVQG